MELRQLEYFAAVASEGTYTAAAARLHVAQPAVWKQVHHLERELGVALFERVGRRVRITNAGSLLLDQVERVVAGAERVVTMAEELRLGRTGRVRVGCFPPHIPAFLAQVVAGFRTSHPHLTVDLVEQGVASSASSVAGLSLVESLRAGIVDAITTAAITTAAIANAAVVHDDLEGFRAYEVRVVAIGGAIRASARRRPRVNLDALRDVPLVVSPIGYFSRGRLDAACRAAGFDPRIEAESSSPAALLALAEVGVGTAILADDAVPRGAGATLLSAAGEPLADEVWLYRLARHRDPAVDAFFEVARATAARS